jgi:hypothetical protein
MHILSEERNKEEGKAVAYPFFYLYSSTIIWSLISLPYTLGYVSYLIVIIGYGVLQEDLRAGQCQRRPLPLRQEHPRQGINHPVSTLLHSQRR